MSRQGHPREHYEAVTRTWLAAKEGGKPNVAVAAQWGVPLTTAARWVLRARQLGILTEKYVQEHDCRCWRHRKAKR